MDHPRSATRFDRVGRRASEGSDRHRDAPGQVEGSERARRDLLRGAHEYQASGEIDERGAGTHVEREIRRRREARRTGRPSEGEFRAGEHACLLERNREEIPVSDRVEADAAALRHDVQRSEFGAFRSGRTAAQEVIAEEIRVRFDGERVDRRLLGRRDGGETQATGCEGD